jgi:hypothetical protein
MIRPVRFTLSDDLAAAMHLELVPVFMQRAGIANDAFDLSKIDGAWIVNCTRELAAGFIEGLQKMIDSPSHLAARKAECAEVIAQIGRVLLDQRGAADN